MPAENTVDNRVSAGERYARIYEINMARCIFCGYCELACPFDAITLGNDFELSEISREALVYTKEMLLEKPLRRTPSKAIDLFDHPVQEMEPALGMYEIVDRHQPRGHAGRRRSQGALVVATVVWFVASAAAIASAFAVILQRNPFISAIALLGNLASLATLYVLLQSDFVAAAQIIVYAGAVMVHVPVRDRLHRAARRAAARRIAGTWQIVVAHRRGGRDPGRAGARDRPRRVRQRRRPWRTASARRRRSASCS